MPKKQTLPPHIQAWLLALLSPFNTPQPSKFDPEGEAYSMVAHYSDAFYSCAYQEEELLDLLLSGRLNEQAAHLVKPAAFHDPAWFVRSMARYRNPKKGDYEAQLMSAITAAGGWPSASYYGLISTVPVLRLHYPHLFERYDLDFLKAAEALQ